MLSVCLLGLSKEYIYYMYIAYFSANNLNICLFVEIKKININHKQGEKKKEKIIYYLNK